MGAASGAASGAVVSGGIAFVTSGGDMEKVKQAAIDGACDGFMSGAITGFVTGGMTSNHCFVAGTVVITVAGKKAIEYIREEGAILVDNEGNELHLLIKKWEQLQSPVPVYNFAVEDYHTYFVGSTKVLVHNDCVSEVGTNADFIVTPEGTVMDTSKNYNLMTS